ncbi:MAG TPA: tRNA (adenosine(37)-N6)-threonylcarbamoyltransferase complex ATPase subunit type 1 TsaE [Phycisphaerales bacterium]|nr:tRNA (adenosine(37)-N6)-threonylcarbamoyltransferase complex ATPase subunit type 1 TsaE [Phycisphaerales bacterium]HCD30765.1 tRNA (adenosine(37)-N6)-threonylcarbamoyltransferase complex ATPase subunit type 1 TsaE [Phycisphaerales bacterium]
MTDTFQIISTSVEQTIALGEALATCLCEGDWVTLDGELGAGKTHLIRGIAQGMGADGHAVASPTFVLMHEYEPEDLDKPLLIHIDAYRLENPRDLLNLGFEDVADESVILIEWASKVAKVLPENRLQIDLQHETDTTRQITFTGYGNINQRIADIQSATRSVAAMGSDNRE